ncbi:hypothetical protein ACQ4LE_009647 [Meloidogyne hapla]
MFNKFLFYFQIIFVIKQSLFIKQINCFQIQTEQTLNTKRNIVEDQSMKIGQKTNTKSRPKTKKSDDYPDAHKEEKIAEFYRKVQNIPIQDDHALQIYQHWAEQAFSNLFAVIANQKLKHFSKPVHDEFGECSKRASSVPLHAKCLSSLILGNFDGKIILDSNKRKNNNFNNYRLKKRADHRKKLMALKLKSSKYRNSASSRKRWVGGLRLLEEPIIDNFDIKNTKYKIATRKSLKRLQILHKIYKEHRRERRQTGIIKKNYYQLYRPSKSRLSPMGNLAKTMMDAVLKSKGKKQKDIIPWQRTVERIKESTQRRNNIKKKLGGSEIKNMDQLIYSGLKRQGVIQEDFNDVIENPEKLQQFLKKKQFEKEKAPLQRIVNLLRDGIKLGYALTGQNSTEIDNKTFKVVSPRFLSVTPEEGNNDTVNFLSPSLFSLHGNGKGIENLTSISSLIKKIGGPVGFSSQDQQVWLDFIMEAAGVIEDAEKIEMELNNTNKNDRVESIWQKHFDKEKYEREIRASDGTPLYFTKQNISDVFAESEIKKFDLFEDLQRKTNINQIREMNQTGYSLLTNEQLKMVYGPDSPYHDPKLLQRFLLLNNSAMALHIENDIHKIANIDSFKVQPMKTGNPQQKRKKRSIILSPISFSPLVLTLNNLNPVILSPTIFSPLILAPSILGPVILSPWIFVPLVLSPRLLTPLILSPPVFSPLILSPIALQPVILSPGAFAPLILSPVLLSPFILSPQVFTPLILSPLALNPFILNPSALSPVILSPFVLSPIILSPAFLSALILSPYALSPLIQSPLIAYSVILSPSYLS